jgi:hypothetical protein
MLPQHDVANQTKPKIQREIKAPWIHDYVEKKLDAPTKLFGSVTLEK